jgi:cyclopropane fatty-acyl-phospholipid synthase-like methyltransferase
MGQESSADGKYSIAAYDDFRNEVLAWIRRRAFGEDIGQFSWVTADEFRRFLKRLKVDTDSVLLDIACGSGGLSFYALDQTNCKVIGLDLSEDAIATASQTAAEKGLSDRAKFSQHDASRPLPLDSGSVDRIISIDAINHLFDKAEVFAEWKRVLRPGGRILFTDAVVVAGVLRKDEILNRSSRMGEFIFTPVGAYENFLEAAGFKDVECEDVTETIADTAQRWCDARAERRDDLLTFESVEQFEEVQRMLATAAALASERRLLRLAFSATKPG